MVFGNVKSQSFSSSAIITQADTVPTGETWKVESVLYDQSFNYQDNGINGITIHSKLKIDGTDIIIRTFKRYYVGSSSGATEMVWEMKYPFWLPAGTIIAPGNTVYGLSVLKFKTD